MDTILTNGVIYTLDDNNTIANTLVIEKGRIAAVGDKSLLSLATSETKVINLRGRPVYPGFGDSHMHVLCYGDALNQVNLLGAASMDELIQRGKEYIRENQIPSGKVVWGLGWNQDRMMEKRMPLRHDLDQISTKHPVVFLRVCEHIASVNSCALDTFGISRHTPQLPGGCFFLGEDGEPNGIFCETALQWLKKGKNKVNLEYIKEIILKVLNIASSYGITSVHSEDFCSIDGCDYNMVIRAYRELALEGQLPVRVNEQCRIDSEQQMEEFFARGYRTGYGDSFFRLGPLKMIGDGSLGARTAWLSHPYEDAPDTEGIPLMTQEEMDRRVCKARSHDMPVAIHAIGDRCLEMALNSVERAHRLMPEKNLRDGIIHCQIATPTLLNDMQRLQVQAYIQPIFLDYDLHIARQRVGEAAARTSYAWKSLLERGIPTSGGSDCPVETMNIIHNIHCAVNRTDLNGEPEGGWYEEQCLSVKEALHLFTKNVAYASGEEKDKGTLQVGKYADLVVLEEDLFHIPTKRIKDVRVEMTMMDGVVRYLRDAR